jgi:hypothetical protein
VVRGDSLFSLENTPEDQVDVDFITAELIKRRVRGEKEKCSH